MSETVRTTAQEAQETESSGPQPVASDSPSRHRRESLRWWIKLIVQPVLFLLAGAALLTGLGVAQKAGWISAGGSGGHQHKAAGKNVRYICPMMCTPPQSEPGRCPVCAMELVPATSSAGLTPSRSIQIDPVARRLANIETVAVKAVTFTRTIKAIGELRYDEGSLKTISAYVGGRLDRLYADYTGVVVKEGDHLAYLYSPKLYSGQVELLEARKSRTGRSSIIGDLYESARQKLLDLGMTKEQIDQVEKDGKANSRIHLCAPISGTVIEKLAVEGQYVKEGQAIYKLADLSTVWLMLKTFPEDASVMRYGQKVTVEVQSLPGRQVTGRVAFIDPMVDRRTRTVGVRVVLSNKDGLLRVGDYAKATVSVPISRTGDPVDRICDPELANKWISPRHPHIISTSPGKCELCGIGLVPASRYGFTDKSVAGSKVLIVPRKAVLMAGENSVVYVETESGRFEIRQVKLGPSSGEEIVLLEGVKEGEKVATSGNFLIDSQMQLAGNPSLIDPAKATPKSDENDEKIKTALASLSVKDRALALRQKVCPVADVPLGSMGAPIKVDVKGKPVFICCKGCQGRLLEQPGKYLKKLAITEHQKTPKDSQPDLPPIGVPQLIDPGPGSPQSRAHEEAKEIVKALSRLSPADRALVEKQKVCVVADMPLGSMGTPVKVDVNGKTVFICCEGCRGRLLADGANYLRKLSREGGK